MQETTRVLRLLKKRHVAESRDQSVAAAANDRVAGLAEIQSRNAGIFF
jgi:hypothetical protein